MSTAQEPTEGGALTEVEATRLHYSQTGWRVDWSPLLREVEAIKADAYAAGLAARQADADTGLRAGLEAIVAEHWDWKAGQTLHRRLLYLLDGTAPGRGTGAES